MVVSSAIPGVAVLHGFGVAGGAPPSSPCACDEAISPAVSSRPPPTSTYGGDAIVRNRTSVERVASRIPSRAVTRTVIRAGTRASLIYAFACSFRAQLFCDGSHDAPGAGVDPGNVMV